MATGSRAAGKQRLVEAGYRNGLPQFAPRCDSCQHCQPGAKQHGRYCDLHRTEVKTHGVCNQRVAHG